MEAATPSLGERVMLLSGALEGRLGTLLSMSDDSDTGDVLAKIALRERDEESDDTPAVVWVPLVRVTAVAGPECAAASSAVLALGQGIGTPPSAVSTEQISRKRRHTTASGSHSSTDYEQEEPELVAAHALAPAPEPLNEPSHVAVTDAEPQQHSAHFMTISPSIVNTNSDGDGVSEGSSGDAEQDRLRQRARLA
mmetsp:Transcript_6212/g.16322  ORF Transcript_6212/g.16322 Transcript_6212/m.16322 type:complete len:195 (-) Transcript_6212:273-857(-)